MPGGDAAEQQTPSTSSSVSPASSSASRIIAASSARPRCSSSPVGDAASATPTIAACPRNVRSVTHQPLSSGAGVWPASYTGNVRTRPRPGPVCGRAEGPAPSPTPRWVPRAPWRRGAGLEVRTPFRLRHEGETCAVRVPRDANYKASPPVSPVRMRMTPRHLGDPDLAVADLAGAGRVGDDVGDLLGVGRRRRRPRPASSARSRPCTPSRGTPRCDRAAGRSPGPRRSSCRAMPISFERGGHVFEPMRLDDCRDEMHVVLLSRPTLIAGRRRVVPMVLRR